MTGIRRASKVGGYKGIRVDRSYIFGGRDFESCLALFARLEVHTVWSIDFLKAFSNKRYIAIQFHSLVRRVRQVCILLALEAGELDSKQ
jgi:hypothetical protein